MKHKKLCAAGLGDQTSAIHAGESPDPVTRASAPNLVMSTAFSVEGMSENDPFVYTRWSNPTIRQLEKKLAALEGAETAVAFAAIDLAAKLKIIHYAVFLIFYLSSPELLNTSFRLDTPKQLESWNAFSENAEDIIADLKQSID